MNISLFGQIEKLNNYKYIVVPEKFEFLKSPDQYQTSSLTKFLLNKKGFNAYISSDDLPKELKENRCLASIANVINKSGLLTIKTQVEFKDCDDKVIFTTEIGKSKQKDYKRAYYESIKKAFSSLSKFRYSYKPLNFKKIISEKDEEILNDNKTTNIIINSEAKNEVYNEKKNIINNVNVLFAQPKNNGFQLVNSKPEVVFLILKTNSKNLFIIKDKNGILQKKGEKWIAEYYMNNKLFQKEYQIKF